MFKNKMSFLFMWSAIFGLALIFFAQTNVQAADGDLDASFNPGTGTDGDITALKMQPDGKVLIAGYFFYYNGTNVGKITRVNADGTRDTSFNCVTLPDPAFAFALQPDGKILIGGGFGTVNGTARNRIARINADGSTDTSFDPGTGADGNVNAVAVQSDGKILIGGEFTTVNGTSKNRIARLNADGTLDTSFNPGSGANFTVSSVTLQPNGKILISGIFATINGVSRSGIARLNSDGSLDTSFNPGAGADAWVTAVALQPDGKILIVGFFNTYNGVSRQFAARINDDGTLDNSFNPAVADSGIYAVALQTDGKILVGGQFTFFPGANRKRIARLNDDGSLDASFNPGMGANNIIVAIALQPDGKAVIGGAFTSYNGVTRNRIARILNSFQVCTAPPPNMVAWYPGDGNANDIITGNNTNGTIQGGVTFATGEVLQAFNFDGTGSVISYSQALNVGTGNGLTIDAWINPTSVSTQQPIAEWNNGANSGPINGIGTHFWISVDSSGNLSPGALFADLIDTNGNVHIIASAGGLITANAYQHVAVTYDKASGNTNLLLNGAIVATQNLGTFTPQTSYPLYFARRPMSTFFYTGGLDEVEIFNRALAQTEIQSIFNAGSAGKCKSTPPPPTSTTPPAGLAAWYRGEGNYNDISGNGNNGMPQVTGSLTFAPGKVGQAFQFDQARVVVPDSNSLDFTTGFTIETWVNPTTPGGDTGLSTLVFKGDISSATNQSYGILYTNTRQIAVRIGNASGIAGTPGSTPLPLNAYSHIAATYDGSNMCIYINGVLDGVCTPTSIGTLGNTTVPLTFGDFAGALDEVSLYNRPLSASEIQSIYNSGTAGKSNSPTAASVSVGGRVMTAQGRGIANVRIFLTDASGETRIVLTNPFGYYRFTDVAAGETCVLRASAKRYKFANPTQVVSVDEAIENANFTALPNYDSGRGF